MGNHLCVSYTILLINGDDTCKRKTPYHKTPIKAKVNADLFYLQKQLLNISPLKLKDSIEEHAEGRAVVRDSRGKQTKLTEKTLGSKTVTWLSW